MQNSRKTNSGGGGGGACLRVGGGAVATVQPEGLPRAGSFCTRSRHPREPFRSRLSPSASRAALREPRCPAALGSPQSSFRLRVPALEYQGRPGRGHPTPRAPALCPAPPRAALPRVREGAPAAPALTRAELPAGARGRRAAQTGVGAGRARAAPMPAPRRDGVRAGGGAAPAASGSAPRASRGPPSAFGEAARPPPASDSHPHTPGAPALAARLRPEEGPRPRTGGPRRRGGALGSRPPGSSQSAPVLVGGRPCPGPARLRPPSTWHPGPGRLAVRRLLTKSASKVDSAADQATPGAWGAPPPI